jgi:hypothetical protein
VLVAAGDQGGPGGGAERRGEHAVVTPVHSWRPSPSPVWGSRLQRCWARQNRRRR